VKKRLHWTASDDVKSSEEDGRGHMGRISFDLNDRVIERRFERRKESRGKARRRLEIDKRARRDKTRHDARIPGFNASRYSSRCDRAIGDRDRLAGENRARAQGGLESANRR